MPDLCIYLQVHQPYRLRPYRLFDIGTGAGYFDDDKNRMVLRRVADKCYLPANRLLTKLIRRPDTGFRIALSLSGTVLEQLTEAAPDAVDSFRALVDTGEVELLGETYYHSLSALADADEFTAQVTHHRELIADHFGMRPTVFRNTELIFEDRFAPVVQGLGYRGVLVEGADHVFGWQSPNYVYESASAPGLRLLPRNYPLSDDVGFRFSNRAWPEWPVTADKYAAWIAESPGDSVHLFMDYETFGEHQWTDTGIFDFLEHLPAACAQRGLRFVHPSTLVGRPAVGTVTFDRPTSWADVERDVTAWLGNRMQQAAHERLYRVRSAALATGDPVTWQTWRRLTTSDHFYYMCTKWFNDGDVHKYFSPFETPYDAFIAFMNVMEDFEQQVASQTPITITSRSRRRPRHARSRGPGPAVVESIGTNHPTRGGTNPPVPALATSVQDEDPFPARGVGAASGEGVTP